MSAKKTAKRGWNARPVNGCACDTPRAAITLTAFAFGAHEQPDTKRYDKTAEGRIPREAQRSQIDFPRAMNH